jgi:hypothetical protein
MIKATTPKLDNWLDRENANPVFVRMRDIADDQHPHLFSFSPDSAEIVGLYDQALESIKAENRSEGAQKAAKTRVKNAERGISQVGFTTGTSKQKQWAAELRMKLTKVLSDGDRELLYDRATHAAWWIDIRDRLSGNDSDRIADMSRKAEMYRKKLRDLANAQAELKAAVDEIGWKEGQVISPRMDAAITEVNRRADFARKFFEPIRSKL